MNSSRRRRTATGRPGNAGEGRQLRTSKERAEEKRREKLAHIREQVATGDLTIRQMTPAERKKHPPRPAEPRRKRW